jgi:multimeric flavodoxin WrbA
MNAVILLGTLKRYEQSNTEVLAEFFNRYLKKEGVEGEIIKLVEYKILPGTYTDMGEGDEWPKVFEKVLNANIVIFATPIWWGNQSSEIQRVIERLDEIHDEIMEGKGSKLEGKVGGIIITGDSDGAQHIIANISNFYNAIGLLLPPYCSLSVLSEKHKKGEKKSKEELFKEYEEKYAQTAEKMVKQLLQYSS